MVKAAELAEGVKEKLETVPLLTCMEIRYFLPALPTISPTMTRLYWFVDISSDDVTISLFVEDSVNL